MTQQATLPDVAYLDHLGQACRDRAEAEKRKWEREIRELDAYDSFASREAGSPDLLREVTIDIGKRRLLCQAYCARAQDRLDALSRIETDPPISRAPGDVP